jgi:IclR family KDG regulon transcriptional repressor
METGAREKARRAEPAAAARASAPAPKKRPAPTRLSSVAMAVKLLKTFSEGEVEIGVTSLAKRLGVAKSTVYRLASTLVSEGMLEQNRENEKYRLGIALFGLGALVRQRMNVSTEARQVMFDLREATGETVHLAILDGSQIMYVLNLESNHAIRMRADLGSRKPAFCTSEGRALLAFQTPEIVERVFAQGFQPRTLKTVTQPQKIRDALEQVRRDGYAREDEQCELGMRSIAAPIRNDAGRVVAAVGVAGPLQRITEDLLASYAPQVMNAASIISARLGYKSVANL